ncbi:MAG: acetyl-CoA carboxylase carboxyl transferase subunit alpha [Clostridiales bacterium]|jgi:acetyl-CoA carboxylase carboxyl transferase subunit alpha|nr:acetyl-CoA carboxylase carboxyl transferase subunit alpha [Clostridiales bacterium]MDN5281255.1 acetyl-CoA carboxylase carboxyl transferase subunit alpha [Candidatus Ozemobacter sp.]
MSRDFEFEKPIIELEARLNELQSISENGKIDLSKEINAIAEKINTLKEEIYTELEPWQVTQVARHIDRPSTLDLIKFLSHDDFVELHGDRLYSDDSAIVAGPGKIGEHKVMFIGHQKGHDTEENIFRNFGMPHPEGYRKALRMMKMADRFNLPVVIFIDTPGAFPGIGAEERGQSEAIARNLAEMSQIGVPILCFVTGEGGSGGALAISVGDRIFMFEYSVYSVISAEGCAAILWNDPLKSQEAAKALKMRAQNLKELGIIDEILTEPLGGAHRNPAQFADTIRQTVEKYLPPLLKLSREELLEQRYSKFRSMGKFSCEEEL